MGRTKKEDKEKALREFCDDVRRRDGVEWRTAVIEEERKEFFRGKDLYRYCEAHPDKLDGIVDTEATLEMKVKELASMMLSTQAVVASERFYKKPHPGRKHLVKFPRKLSALPRSDQAWDPEAFYVWLEDRPMPPWQYAMAAIMALAIMAVCLFPLAPYWARISVVYFFLGLLCAIFALIIFRFCIFLSVFAVSGMELWLFPNLLSDQVDVIGAFVPVVTFEKPADGKSHLGTRIGGLVGVGVLVYMLYVYTPDEDTLRSNLREANDSILDMFMNANNPSLGDGTGFHTPPQYGSDRNIDPEKIRQKMFAERQRRKEEIMRKKTRRGDGGEGGDAPEQGQSDTSNETLEEREDSEGSQEDDQAEQTTGKGGSAPGSEL